MSIKGSKGRFWSGCFLFFLLCKAGQSAQQNEQSKAISISRSPSDVGVPLVCKGNPTTRKLFLEAKELEGLADQNKIFPYWTFNGKVPAPFFRVCEGDTVEVHFKSHEDNTMVHSVDFHAATGPGGGAVHTENTGPGESKSFSFKALRSGLYVYHCASIAVAQHIAPMGNMV